MLLGSQNLFSQCEGGINVGTITPTTAWQTYSGIYGGDYLQFNATAGDIYYFSYCTGDGGVNGFDTEISIVDNTDTYVGTGGYSDDDCSDPWNGAYLEWTCPTSGTYRVLTTAYLGSPWYDWCMTTVVETSTLAYKKYSPPGVTCATPIVVTTYPYSNSTSTCLTINNYGNQCGGVYGGGHDQIYQLNIVTTGIYTIDVTATTEDYIGWFLKSNGNCTTDASCLTSVESGLTSIANGTYNFVSAGTYYLIVDTRTPQTTCAAYTLTITPPVSVPTCPTGLGSAGVDVFNISIDAGYGPTASNTNAVATNHITSSNSLVCGSSNYYTGYDNVYIFTPAVTGNITVTLTSAGTWTNLVLYEGCPLNQQGGSCVNYSQSSSGNKSFCAAVTSGSTYYLLIDSWSTPISNAYTLTITAPSGSTTGYDCANPTVIASLPYSATGKSTACSGNDYTSASTGACSSSYLSGEDYVYEYVAASAECISVTLANTNAYAGFSVYKDCPGIAGATCLGTFYGAYTCNGSINIPSTGTYYIIVDSDASGSMNTPFDISITSSGSGQTNDLPCSATTLVMGTMVGGDNSCSGSFGEPSTPSCWTSGTMNTVWYSFVAPSTQVKIRTGLISLTNTQIALYSGTCNSLTAVSCNDNQPTCGSNVYNNSEIIATGLTSGATYFIRVDGTASLVGTFSIMVVDNTVSTAFPYSFGQDCPTPIPACSNSLNVGNPGYQGIGNYCDFGSSINCLTSGERGIVWYEITIQDGTFDLGFIIEPNDLTVTWDSWTSSWDCEETDYDFAIWKMKNADGSTATTCADFADGNPAPVQCNYSYLGVTGLYTGGLTPSGYDCDYDGAFETPINVATNEVFLLGISNYSNSTSGFSITYSNGAGGTSPISTSASPSSLTWTGGAASTDWFDADNWGGCAIPTEDIDVYISPSSSFQPDIDAAGAECKSITINPGSTLTIDNTYNLDIWGNYYNYGTLAAADNSTVTLRSDGTDGLATPSMNGNMLGISNFGNLLINKTAGNVELNAAIEIAGTFTTSSTTSDFDCNSFKIQVGGNVTFANTSFTCGTGTLECYGTNGTQTITTGGNSNYLYNFTVNKTDDADDVILANDLYVNNDVRITKGELDVSGSSYDIYIYNGGDWINTGGTFTYQQGQVLFVGNADQNIFCGTGSFYDVVMNKSGGDLLLQSTLTLANDLILTAGTLDITTANHNISIAGDWFNNSNSTGLFEYREGTVLFNGVATQKCNVKADGTTVYPEHFDFYNVIIDGTDVWFYYKSSTNKKLEVHGDTEIVAGKKLSTNDL